jgi:hypothetical protein
VPYRNVWDEISAEEEAMSNGDLSDERVEEMD